MLGELPPSLIPLNATILDNDTSPAIVITRQPRYKILEGPMANVTLPDGSTLDVADGATVQDVADGATVQDIAQQIGPGLAKAALEN